MTKSVLGLGKDILEEWQNVQHDLRNLSGSANHHLDQDANVILKVDCVGVLKHRQNWADNCLELIGTSNYESLLLSQTLEDVHAFSLNLLVTLVLTFEILLVDDPGDTNLGDSKTLILQIVLVSGQEILHELEVLWFLHCRGCVDHVIDYLLSEANVENPAAELSITNDVGERVDRLKSYCGVLLKQGG